MDMDWNSQKGTGLLAIIVGLGFIGIAFMDSQYRYFYLCVAIIALIYGYRQFKKRDTPFERREREERRKKM